MDILFHVIQLLEYLLYVYHLKLQIQEGYVYFFYIYTFILTIKYLIKESKKDFTTKLVPSSFVPITSSKISIQPYNGEYKPSLEKNDSTESKNTSSSFIGKKLSRSIFSSASKDSTNSDNPLYLYGEIRYKLDYDFSTNKVCNNILYIILIIKNIIIACCDNC